MQRVFSFQKELIDQFKYKEVLTFTSVDLQEELFMKKMCNILYRNTSQIIIRYISAQLNLEKETTEHSAESHAEAETKLMIS